MFDQSPVTRRAALQSLELGREQGPIPLEPTDPLFHHSFTFIRLVGAVTAEVVEDSGAVLLT